MILLFGVLTTTLSCNNVPVEKGYFIIGEHHKKVSQERIKSNRLPSPPPPPIDYYGRNNILLTDTLIFMHVRPMRLFPGCGTGLSYDKIARIDLRKEEIIKIAAIDEILNRLKLEKEYGLVDIASITDTIRNPSFKKLIKALSRKQLDLIRVRTFSQEEYWVIKSILDRNPYSQDSVQWDKIPKLDVLFDLDKDGEFEIHESLN